MFPLSEHCCAVSVHDTVYSTGTVTRWQAEVKVDGTCMEIAFKIKQEIIAHEQKQQREIKTQSACLRVVPQQNSICVIFTQKETKNTSFNFYPPAVRNGGVASLKQCGADVKLPSLCCE